MENYLAKKSDNLRIKSNDHSFYIENRICLEFQKFQIDFW